MDLWIIVIILFIAAIALIAWSFYKQDTGEKIQEEFEELSLQWLQEVNHLKERVVVLETELDVLSDELPKTDKVHEVVKNNIITLYTQGVSTEDISRQTRISEMTVKAIIDDYVLEV